MPLFVVAIYEDGVLKPVRPLPLQEHETVRLTVHTGQLEVRRASIIPDINPRLIEWAAMDPDLEFPPPPRAP